MKSWEAARQQCREEGYSEGVGEADLAYFETSQELQEVIGKHLQERKLVTFDFGILLGLMDDETAWLRGKMETDGVKVMDTDNSMWTRLTSLPNGINWLRGAPVADINTDRKLFIEKSSEKLGVGQGSYAKGFLCEFKKKGIKKVKYYIQFY